jgi:hypothetical protein
MAAGVVAGLASWMAVEWAHDVFRPRLFGSPRWEAVWMEPTPESQNAADLKNSALAFGLLGCFSSLAMGVAGGLVAGAPSRGIVVGLGAQAVGVAVGALAASTFIPVFHPNSPDRFATAANDLWSSLFLHGTVWAAVGATAGATFAIGMRSRHRLGNAVGSSMASALLAAVCFQLIATCLPLEAGADRPVARWAVVRLLAMFLPSVMIAAGAALGTIGDVGPMSPDQAPRPADQCRSPLESSSGSPR